LKKRRNSKRKRKRKRRRQRRKRKRKRRRQRRRRRRSPNWTNWRGSVACVADRQICETTKRNDEHHDSKRRTNKTNLPVFGLASFVAISTRGETSGRPRTRERTYNYWMTPQQDLRPQ
jgi:hypothetical protein